MPRIFPSLAVPVLLACTATAVRAQEIRYGQIPWDAAVGDVRSQLEALGWPYRGTAPSGDLAFVRPDGAEVDVYVRDDHPFRIVQIDAVRGAGVEARYRVLADSVQAVLRDPVDQRPELRAWEKGLTSVTVAIIQDPRTGERTVQMQWRGPDFIDAMESRQASLDFPRPPAGWMTVRSAPGVRTVVDTATVQRTAHALAGRFRTEYLDVRTVGADRFDALEYRMEFDCGAGRARVLDVTAYLAGERKRSETPPGQIWQPARAGTDPSRALDAVCRAGGGGPGFVAAPAPVRAFGAVPAGWVMISEDVEGRRLLRTSSITPLGNGVYSAVMLLENGRPSESPYGMVDASRFEFEVNCPTGQMRFKRRITQFAGRDVHSDPPPAGFENWQPAPDNSPVPVVLCRIARERGL